MRVVVRRRDRVRTATLFVYAAAASRSTRRSISSKTAGAPTGPREARAEKMAMRTTKKRQLNPGTLALSLTAAALLGTASPAGAQTTTQFTSTHIVEWDIPSAGDIEPGAVVVDT